MAAEILTDERDRAKCGRCGHVLGLHDCVLDEIGAFARWRSYTVGRQSINICAPCHSELFAPLNREAPNANA